jgi:predicted Fe-Mo cluster-binding NifX family protein
MIFDSEKNSFEVVNNEVNLNAAQGAGIQAAQTIVKAGAGALVTGHCGPKAFRVLAAAGVKVYNTDAPTISEALSRFRAGQLTEAVTANVEGHWA